MTGNIPYDLCMELFECIAEKQLSDVYAKKKLVARTPHLIHQMENNIEFLQDYLDKVALEPKDIITYTLIREIKDNIVSAKEAIHSFKTANKSKSLISAVNPYSDLVQSSELVRTVYDEVNTTRNKVEKHIYKLSRYENTNKAVPRYSENGGTQEYEKAYQDGPIIPRTTSRGEGTSRKRKRGTNEDDNLMSTMKMMMAEALSAHIGKSNDQMAKFVRSSAEVDNQKKDNRHMLNEELKKLYNLTKCARQKAALKLIRNLDLLDYFFTLDDDEDKEIFIELLLREN